MDRLLRNTAATLSVTFYSDEAATDADGAVTVTVVADDGTVIATDAATSAGEEDSGQYTYTLAPQTDLNRLTLTWTGTFSAVEQSLVTRAEVVGARLFTYAQARASDTLLANTSKYPTTVLERIRSEVEDEFESIAARSFIPRYGRTRRLGQGSDVIRLDHADILTLRSVTVDGVAFTEDELDGCTLDDWGLLYHPTGTWTQGLVIVVQYEYGLPYVTTDLSDVAMKRARSRITDNNTGIPDRATSFDTVEGGTYQLATPGRAGWETGIPDVDAVIKRYSLKGPGVY